MYPTEPNDRRIASLRILSLMSGFLRKLDIAEGDILRRMLVRFALDATGADLGGLAVRDHNRDELRYHLLLHQDGETTEEIPQPPLPLMNPFRHDSDPQPRLFATQESLSGETGLVNAIPGQRAISLIRLPIVVDDILQCILEVATLPGGRLLDNQDLETLTIITNIAAAAMENSQLFVWAISDPLTGLANVHYFRKNLQMEIKRAQRYKVPFSVAMLDLDHFKTVNDTYGHAQGDEVLIRLAAVLRENLRVDVDLPGRYGGDEFVLLLPNTPKEGAFVVMNRILRIFRDILFTHKTLGTFNTTLSIGIASFPEQAGTPEDLLALADQALYQAKKAGRNRIRIHGTE